MSTRSASNLFGLMALLVALTASASEWNSGSFDLYPGDFDGDGSTDVLYVARAPSGRSGIALSNGKEWVAGAQSWDSDGFGVQWHSNAYLPIVGDFNWDGRDDIFVQRKTPGDHFLLLAQLDGTFAGASQTISNNRAGLTWSADQHRIIALRGKSLDPAHAKGHRLFLQAVARGGSNAIIDTSFSQLIGTTTVGGAWSDGYRGFKWNLRASLVHAGDFNGDGEGDLLVQAKPAIVVIDYDVPFPIPVSVPASFGVVYSPVTNGITDIWDHMRAGVDWSTLKSDLVIGDFDGDGRDDVLVQARGAGNAHLVLTSPGTGLLNLSSPSDVAFANSTSASGHAYRILAANINGGASEKTFGVYLQTSNAAGTDLIAHDLSAGGGTVATTSEAGSSQLAGHAEKAFTPAYRYNLGGQVTGTIDPDPDGSGPLKYLATRNYYDRGLLVRTESGELQRWVNEIVSPANWEQASAFTKFVVNEYSYDEYGRKIIERVRRGDTGETDVLVQYNYDIRSRVLCRAVRMNRITYGSLPGACDPTEAGSHGEDRISRFTYDELDQVVTEERGVGTSLRQTYVKNDWAGRLLRFQTDANGNKTELKYDGFSRLERRIYPSQAQAGSQNLLDYEAFTYEATGKIKTQRKRSGEVITYTYDANNRVLKKDLSDPTARDVYYDYYPNGATRAARYGSLGGPGIANGVDEFGRLEWTRINAASATTSSGPSYRLSYEYDDNGNRVKVTHPDNQFFGYAYDGLNRSCGAAESAVPMTCDAQQLMVSVRYRNDGGRSTLSRGGVTTSYVPDPVGRLKSFTLDLPGGDANDLTNEFGYSPAGQIAQLTQSNISYSYAGNANRTGRYARNGLNQITEVAGQAIAYDRNGNLTTDSGLNYSMTYDMENRLIATSGAPAVTASLKYDPLGRLAQLTVGSVTRDFLYDGDSLIGEYESGALKKRFVHGNQVDEPWVLYNDNLVDAAHRHYLFADHQGSIIAQSNSDGSGLRKLAYDSYGIPLDTNEGRFGYTGQLWIQELGLFYYKARMYSPKLGRFLQTDPIGYDDNYNLYSYGGNDPVNAIDPLGTNMVLQEEKSPPPPPDPIFLQCRKGDPVITGEITELDPSLIRDLGFAAGSAFNFLGAFNGGVNPVTREILLPVDIQNSFGELGINVIFAGAGLWTKAAKAPAQVTLNRIAGNAFRDELAAMLRLSGREVATEVYKRTPFGSRFIDIEVSLNDVVLGGIETKVGKSPYKSLQRLKDSWLRWIDGYYVDVARRP